MNVSIGDAITAAQHNDLVNRLNSVWGDNFSTNTTSNSKTENSFGWGQTPAPFVAIGDAITAIDKNELINRLNLSTTQTGTGSTIPKVVAGEVITASEYNSIDSEILSLISNRFIGADTTVTSGGSDGTESRGSWHNAISITMTATFSDYTEARYFFNSGGQLRYSLSNNGSSSDAIAWQDLFDSSDMGSLIFSYNDIAQTGTRIGTVESGSGFYELTTTPTKFYEINLDISPYTSSKLSVYCSRNSDGNVVTIRFDLDNEDPGTQEGVNGTTTMYLDSRISDNKSDIDPTVSFSITSASHTVGNWSGS